MSLPSPLKVYIRLHGRLLWLCCMGLLLLFGDRWRRNKWRRCRFGRASGFCCCLWGWFWNCWGFSLHQKAMKRSVNTAVFVAHPTQLASVAQGIFGGSRHWVGAHTRPAGPKVPSAPSTFPLFEAPQAPGNKPNPKGGKILGWRPPEANRNLQLSKHTRPDPCRCQHGRPKCNPTTGEKCSVITAAGLRSPSLVLD